ncbi:putative metalloprotease CJM1_0395 family protein [Helicobacter turcicus]|uniref:SrpA-related protein n=1 Tax=Helicobacter turcicus TaxID=2867412 RepID=A0ABS7JL24_9HELI|nr:putative metalloprotease CJM1_0395 family protein [Helicobacter turcicus]MBX7490081.1 hypothetical protein [Helicobacter turcicus]MBX7544940.1 hypothetical protein [Helicobacter turcicus]
MQVGNVMSVLQNSYLYTSRNVANSINFTDTTDFTKRPFFAEEIEKIESKKDSVQSAESVVFDTSVESKDSKKMQSATDEKALNGETLDEEETQYVRELERIDRNVRAHEAAHIAAGAGVVTGGASFTYTRGPDGKMYATAGEVPITMKEGKTPEETIQNARQIVAAAMAPSDPSPQDYKVAASAAQMESKARSEQVREKAEEVEEALEKQEEAREKDSIEQNMASKVQDKSESKVSLQRDFNSNMREESLLRDYAIQSYKVNFTNPTPLLEIVS